MPRARMSSNARFMYNVLDDKWSRNMLFWLKPRHGLLGVG
jgi:hypothetical protein